MGKVYSFERVKVSRSRNICPILKADLKAKDFEYFDDIYSVLRVFPDDSMGILHIDEDNYMKLLAECERHLPEQFVRDMDKPHQKERLAAAKKMETAEFVEIYSDDFLGFVGMGT